MMNMRFPFFVLLFSLLFCSREISAQDKERLHRSLKAIENTIPDTSRIKYLDDIGWDTSYSDLEAGVKYCSEALALAEKINYKKGIIHASNSLGAIYLDLGDLNKSLANHLAALKLAEKTNDQASVSVACMSISNVYIALKEHAKAIPYLLRSRDISEKRRDTVQLIKIYGNIGLSYLSYPDSLQKAIVAFQKSLALAYTQKDPSEAPTAMIGLAMAYHKAGDSAKADQMIKRSMFMLDSLQNPYTLSIAMEKYAAIQSERGNYEAAEKILMQVLAIYRKIGMAELEKELWNELADLYQHTGQLQKAIDALKRYSVMKDSLMNENALRHQKELETLYQTEKTNNENEKLKRNATLTNTIVTSLVVGVLLLLVILFILYNRSQLRKKTNTQLEKQNAIIEEKNKDITDSINYAKRIQDAVLPSAGLLKKQFSDAFVFYRPRDIVSGDFWWCTEKNGKFVLAAADCTGHGVPGGFMSVMSAAFLSEIINEKGITEPAQILELLRQKVITSLKQANEKSAGSSEVKDGMDISIASFSNDNSKMQLACANNPVWRVRNGEVKVFNPDKFPVGIHHNELMPFTPQNDDLKPGDMIYMFSDGYADQFGGKEGKKYKYKQLRDELLASSNFVCDQQGKIMERKFDEWRGQNEQVDDVLLIGIRI
jgi:serine phosphatase RsbU (regulator of sigma subunit)